MSANSETESHEQVLDESCVCDEQGVVLKTIKSSYNTYIATVMSGRVDCTRRASQNAPCHSHIITLVEHVMESNDALLFRTRMNELKETCAMLMGDDKGNKCAFPAEPPDFVEPEICCKFRNRFVVKTPVWAIQHCLSLGTSMSKKYCFEISNEAELLRATDGAFIICGLINPLCTPQDAERHAAAHPHDPLYDIVSPNCREKKIPSAVLFIPAVGCFYSPRFVSNTSRLQAKNLWLRNMSLASAMVLHMLPSTALRLRRDNGFPGEDGHLSTFTDIYRIDVSCRNNSIETLTPILRGIHVSDDNICIPHDIILCDNDCKIQQDGMVEKNNKVLRKVFVEELFRSRSNRTGCRRYVPKSFIAYPETYVHNPLVVDSSLIQQNKQVVVHIHEDSTSTAIGIQSSIRVQHISGDDYSSL